MARSKEKSLKDYLKLLCWTFGGAILLYFLIGFSATSFIAIVIFIMVLDKILEIFENDSPTKRLLTKIYFFTTVIVMYLGIRMIVGYIIGMPLVDTWKSLDGIGIIRLPAGKFPVEIVLELLFIIPGVGIAYGFIKGGSKTKSFICMVSFFMFVLIAFQLKQPELFGAIKRNSQIRLDLGTSRINLNSINKEVITKITWGSAIVPISHVYIVATDPGTKKIVRVTPVSMKMLKGETVQMVEPDRPPKEFNGQLLTNVRLVNQKTGSFIGGETKYWVETTFFRWYKNRLASNDDDMDPGRSKTKSNFKIYPPGTYTFSLKAGETTDHWIMFPYGRVSKYDPSSNKGLFVLKYDDGTIVKSWESTPWPNKQIAKFKITAIKYDQIITLCVK